MANKRQLKKQIKYICGDIACECIMARNYFSGINSEKMNEIIYNIASLQTSSLKRVSISYDKIVSDFGSKQEYNIARSKYFAEAYNKLTSDFNAEINKLIKAMNDILPSAQKEANIKALA